MTDPATYRAQLETIFLVEQDAVAIPLRLVDVADERVSGGMRQFSLLFHGPADRLLPQGTYTLRHEALGDLDLFIVPIAGSNRERIVYQACFNVPVVS